MSGSKMLKAMVAAFGATALLGTASLVNAAVSGSKTVDITRFTRTYEWDIEKTAGVSSLTLSVGQTYDVGYEVKVTQTYQDSDFYVGGVITINYEPANGIPLVNGNGSPFIVTSVTDWVDSAYEMPVYCPSLVSGPFPLVPGTQIQCTYDGYLPDGSQRTNSATVYGYYDSDPGNSIELPAGTADVIFGVDPWDEIDECIDVTDTNIPNGGVLDTVCRVDRPFNYLASVGPYGAPGTYYFDNFAAFTTSDTQLTYGTDWRITVNVPQPAPEPGTLSLLGLALAGLAATRRRKT